MPKLALRWCVKCGAMKGGRFKSAPKLVENPSPNVVANFRRHMARFRDAFGKVYGKGGVLRPIQQNDRFCKDHFEYDPKDYNNTRVWKPRASFLDGKKVVTPSRRPTQATSQRRHDPTPLPQSPIPLV